MVGFFNYNSRHNKVEKQIMVGFFYSSQYNNNLGIINFEPDIWGQTKGSAYPQRLLIHNSSISLVKDMYQKYWLNFDTFGGGISLCRQSSFLRCMGHKIKPPYCTFSRLNHFCTVGLPNMVCIISVYRIVPIKDFLLSFEKSSPQVSSRILVSLSSGS